MDVGFEALMDVGLLSLILALGLSEMKGWIGGLSLFGLPEMRKRAWGLNLGLPEMRKRVLGLTLGLS